jgi:O-antigen biosynthesis protein
MVAGRIEPRDVDRLMATLDAGIAEGLSRQLSELTPLVATSEPFLTLRGTGPRPNLILAGRSWQGRRLRQSAISAVGGGNLVTVLRLSPTTLFHKVRFMPQGYWLQTGGIFGKSDRSGRVFTLTSFNGRRVMEERRIWRTRPA